MKVRGVFSLCTILILLWGGSSSFAQEYEDVVYLKNGKVRRGLILERIVGESVKLETNYGEIFVIKMSDISKIAKEEKAIPVAAEVQGTNSSSGPPPKATKRQTPVASCAVERFCSEITHSLLPSVPCGSTSPLVSSAGVQARRWHAPRLHVA